MILGQIQENPGVDQLNETIRTTLRKCAQDEFNKERLNFGSVWWSGKVNFPSWLQENIVKLIRVASAAFNASQKSGGGGAGRARETETPNPCSALLVSAEEEARALQAAVESGEAEGKNLEWWRPKPKGSLDRDSALYAKLKMMLEIATWSVRREPLVDWEDFCERVSKAEAFQAKKKQEDEEKAQRKATRRAHKALEKQNPSGGGGHNSGDSGSSGHESSRGGGRSGGTNSNVGALLQSSDSSDSELESQAEESFCSSNFSDSPSPGESSESDGEEAGAISLDSSTSSS